MSSHGREQLLTRLRVLGLAQARDRALRELRFGSGVFPAEHPAYARDRGRRARAKRPSGRE